MWEINHMLVGAETSVYSAMYKLIYFSKAFRIKILSFPWFQHLEHLLFAVAQIKQLALGM